jgi:hypothetical protein
VLLAKEEITLQGLTTRLIENGRCFDMKINMEKIEVMKISRQLFPLKITIDKKQLKNVNISSILVA